LSEPGSPAGAERTGGLRRPLGRAWVYSAFQRTVGAGSSKPRFVREHLRPKDGERILDVGCGPGELAGLLDQVADVEYTGIDPNPDYIATAERRFPGHEFRCTSVEEADLPEAAFDAVAVMGVIHHLTDAQVEELMRLATHALVGSGRLVAIEPAFSPGQPRVARWLISRDRGAAVRSPEGYERLARPWFEQLDVTVRGDLLRVPYTHAVLECAGPRSDGPQAASAR
jgi:SAM-dependent methyltransferase